MPRWLQVLLCLVLFNVIMALIWWGLREWVPATLAWSDFHLTSAGTWVIIGLVAAACAYVAYWPRDANGARRPLLPRRR